MSAQRPKPSRRRLFICAVSVTLAAIIGTQARAQVDENIQARTSLYTIPNAPAISGAQQLNYDVCIGNAQFIAFLRYIGQISVHPEIKDPQDLIAFFSARDQRAEAARILNDYFIRHPKEAKIHWQKLKDYFAGRGTVTDKAITRFLEKAIAVFPTSFCAPQTSVKVLFPFNPTYETNILKSNLGDSPGTSVGFGGALQVTTPGLRKLDVIGLSVQSQSVRYGQFSSKNFDAITTQAAYQFFLDAHSFDSMGQRFDIDENTKPAALPPANMITVDTVAFGFQNQTVYVPLFHLEQVNLFTPQVTFSHQNMPLFGGGQCALWIPDPRKVGYCYYADISVTVGQTFADVPTQENTNVAFAVTPGWRIKNTDWKLTLPATVTARDYQNVPGGRQDLQLQIGPTLAYSPPPFIDPAFITSVLFTLSTTYNQNYSTVAKNSWHGIIVMPTLTIAFAP